MIGGSPYRIAIITSAAIHAAWATMAAARSHFHKTPGGLRSGTSPAKRHAGFAAAGRSWVARP
jgi:hypothetical protein